MLRETCLAIALVALGMAAAGHAQLTDVTQTPNTENEGIQKSLPDQIGTGQGDVITPDSSIFLIQRDPFRSIRRGRQLFQRKFTGAQGLGPRTGDGVGDIEADASVAAGLADSCASCHGRPRGSAGFGGNVFTRPDSRDAPHLFGLGLIEMLADEITTDLRAIRDLAILEAIDKGDSVTAELQSKDIDYGEITANPDGTVETNDVEGVNADLRVRPFFAQGGTISMREFIVGALNAEMGMEAFDPLLASAASGGAVVTPAGLVLDGALDTIEGPPAASPSDDPDGDGVVDEVNVALVDHLEFYLLNYFKPGTHVRQPGVATRGRQRMSEMGCLSCHVADLEIQRDRRVADVETTLSAKGIFNRLFATATGLFTEVDDGFGFPTLKEPVGGSFLVENVFTDLKRHDVGPGFWERNFDGTLQKEFVTEPLWGAGSTPPYGHDGRSIDLEEVILRHGGEAAEAREAYQDAPSRHRQQVVAFLQSLVLFPPDDTASNLNPGDPSHPDFPQHGHGSIALTVLFNDPGDIE